MIEKLGMGPGNEANVIKAQGESKCSQMPVQRHTLTGKRPMKLLIHEHQITEQVMTNNRLHI